MERSNRGRRILILVFIAPFAFFAFGGIVMLLWNNVLVDVLHVSTITFWQAWGILILSKILFGSFGGSNPRRNIAWKKRMQERWAKRQEDASGQ